MKFSAHVWYRRSQIKRQGDPPSYAAVSTILAEIERELDRAGMRPVELKCENWPSGTFPGEHATHLLARITIEAEPGTPTRSLRSWFEWQHPRWVAGGALPLLESVSMPLLGAPHAEASP